MLAEFNIVTCCGDFVKTVTIPVDAECVDWDAWNIGKKYEVDVLCAGGRTNYQCQGCYDWAFRVEFVGWVAELVESE